jgi:hypothetical protein
MNFCQSYLTPLSRPDGSFVSIAHYCTDRLIGGKKSARQNTTDLAGDSRNGIKISAFHRA